jgi:hypothetical protein
MKICDRCASKDARLFKVEIHDVERCAKEYICLDLCPDCMKDRAAAVWAALLGRGDSRAVVKREDNIL